MDELRLGAHGVLLLNANGSYSYFGIGGEQDNNGHASKVIQDTFAYTANDFNGGTATAALTFTLMGTPTRSIGTARSSIYGPIQFHCPSIDDLNIAGWPWEQM
jgi:VCBS repeat-containing protein